MEICRNCGIKTDPTLNDMIQDLYNPSLYNFKCPKCGTYNRITSRKSFVNPIEFKNKPIPQQPIKSFENKIEKQIFDINDDAISSNQLLPGNPFAPILEGFEKKHMFQKELDIEKNKRRKYARTPGSSWTNCLHEGIVTKNGITYCPHCGRNFKERDLINLGYHDINLSNNIASYDRAIDDIFAQEPDFLLSQESKGSEHPRKNPFVYSGEITPFINQPSLVEMKKTSLNTEKSVNAAMKELFG